MVFFCWWLSDYLDVFPIAIAFSYGGGEGCIESDFVDEAETCGADAETDPAVLFHIVELTAEEVYIEGALRATLGVGNVVSGNNPFVANFAIFGHFSHLLLGFSLQRR